MLPWSPAIAPPPAAYVPTPPSTPRLAEGVRCRACGRANVVSVVYQTIGHSSHSWAQAVYACECCGERWVKGQK